MAGPTTMQAARSRNQGPGSLRLKEVAVVIKRFSIVFLVILLTCGSTAIAAPDPLDIACSESGSVAQRAKLVSGSRLGVRLQGLTPQLAEYFGLSSPAGALISWVEEGSPAQIAGLKAGDIILSVGGERVEDPSDTTRTIMRKPAGAVEIVVVRDKQERSFTAQLEKGQQTWLVAPRGARSFRILSPRNEFAPLKIKPLKIKPLKVKPRAYSMKSITKPVFRARPEQTIKPKFERPKIKVKPARVRRGTVLL